MNSRSEFNRCHIPRLVVEMEEEGAKKEREAREQKELEELLHSMEQADITWEERKRLSKELTKKKRRRETDRGGEGSKDYFVENEGRRKKLRYSRVEEGWGEPIEEEGELEIKEGEEQGSHVVNVGACDLALPTLPTPQGRRIW